MSSGEASSSDFESALSTATDSDSLEDSEAEAEGRVISAPIDFWCRNCTKYVCWTTYPYWPLESDVVRSTAVTCFFCGGRRCLLAKWNTPSEEPNTREGIMSDAMSVILCTAGYDHTIRFWEALSGICTRQINYSDSQVNRLCISPDKRYLAAAGHHSVKLYLVKSSGSHSHSSASAQTADQTPILSFEGHTNNITGVGFHIDTKWMVTSSEDGTVKIWDTKTGSVQRNYSHGSPVNDVVIHPNQGELISCDREGNVRIWDLGENKCSHQLIPEEGVSVASVSVASDGSLLCAGNNKGNVYVWRMLQTLDTTSLVPVTKFAAHNTYITRVLLSPDVKHLATCSADHLTRIWAVDPPDALDGQPPGTSASVSTNGTNSTHPSSQSLSSQRNINSQQNLAAASAVAAANGLPREPNAFPLEATLQGHQRWVWDCAFSADSAYLVTACSDHYARLWELSSQSIIRQYNGHHRGAVCVALNDYSEGR